ncbi:hypothetical protein SAMN05443249_1556 [Beijerinckia sp. 28-YEA-48]|nr:hypothetical protein SAMN05443249_1556 [Beijerinckia sp. 28-YEA-48]
MRQRTATQRSHGHKSLTKAEAIGRQERLMSRNRINIEGEDRGYANVRFGRTLAIALSTLVIGGALVLAQGNGVKAANGATVQVAVVKVAVAETVALAPTTPQAAVTQVQPRKAVRVIPLYNIPADQAAAQR